MFCLSPAGDTPSSARLFDAIVSGCIPVVVSDELELPFEGILDYRQVESLAAFFIVVDSLHWCLGIISYMNETTETSDDFPRFKITA